MKNARFLVLALSMGVLPFVSACGSVETEAKYPTGMNRSETGGDIYGKRESILGEDALKIGGKKNKGEADNGMDVNSFLWRASLDTVSFMPLSSVDPFGGVILTDWYSAPETPNERMKLNVFVMSRELRADGVRVRVFRQVQGGGTWKEAAVSEQTTRDLEDAILTRARQLRVEKLGSEK